MPGSIGEIITFYSYKGGTGRSMVLANVGYLLSGRKYRNRRVLMIDWDLEAPGLERFFGDAANSAGPGLIDYLVKMAERYRSLAPGTSLPESMARDSRAVEIFRTSAEEHPLDNYIIQLNDEPQLLLMRAGQRPIGYSDSDGDYREKVRNFDWDQFYNYYGSFFTHFRELLMSKFDYVLIDSRTGLTDIGGICTRVMPEKLVLVFAPNHQNIDGVVSMARSSIHYRMDSRDARPLTVFPVAARIDASASKLRTAWWRGGTTRGERVTGYQPIFENLLREMYKLEECDLKTYFDATQVPYDSDYAYGEAIAAAIDGTDDRLGIGYACDQLTWRLVEQVAPWENPGEREGRTDFLVSYAGADRAWAEWVAWQLTDAGYNVELDVWNWAAGQNFITAMSDALDRCDRVVALFSATYFDRDRYTAEEWTTALSYVPGIGDNRLVPLRVEEVPAEDVPAMLRPLMYRDLFGVDEEQARQILLEAVAGPRRPDGEPMLGGRHGKGGLRKPEGAGPPLPGSVPRIWNIPARNPGFTGRDGLLGAVRERLLAGDRAVVQALQGMGGVGKTQLAVEYAYRFAGTYDLAWWVNAEQPGLIGDQFAALGMALGCVQPGADTETVRAAVLAELRSRGRWLLVFDNAADPADITGWLPGGGGHVLITSRARGWAAIAAPVEVDVLARAESVAILHDRVARLSEGDADRLSDQLGDLPLALAQAAGFIAETGTPAEEYLELLRTRAGQLLDHATPGSYPRSLAAATGLIADRLAADDPAAAQLASLCAFLAPEPIPEDVFTIAVAELPGELAAAMADPLAWRQTLMHLAEQSLARFDQRGLVMHRLTQAILRDRLTPARAAAARDRTEAILAVNDPKDPANPATWPKWAQLMPHLLAAHLAATRSADVRSMACNACWYLLARGDTRTAYDLAADLRQHWRDRLGDDHEHTLAAASYLAGALRTMGRYAEARDLAQDTLDRRRRILGADHPDTLASASNLAIDLRELGEVQAARDLDQDTLDRRRRILGADHPDTLASASNLAIDLRELGEVQAARDLDQDTLDRRRRILGADHPDTLASASNLAIDLYQLGEVQAARDLDQDTLDRRRRILGADHPDTLASASNLAIDLRELGEVQAARDLDQDTLNRRRRILGADHPSTLRSANNLAIDLRNLGEVADGA